MHIDYSYRIYFPTISLPSIFTYLILSYPNSFFQFVLKVISSDEEGGKEEKRIYNGLLEGTIEKRNKGKKGEVDIIKER